MNTQTITRPPTVKTPAYVASQEAYRALRATRPSAMGSLLSALTVLRAAESLANCHHVGEDQSEALYQQRDLIWDMIAKAPIETYWDAVAKLELVAETWERGERSDEADVRMLRAVTRWLRAGGLN